MSFGKSESESSSNYENNPWAPSHKYLEDALGQAKDVYKDPIKRDTAYMTEMQDLYRNMMQGGNEISAQDITKRASQYVDPAMVQGMKDANQEQLQGALMGQTASQLGTGDAGGSRSGIAAGLATAESNQNLNRQMLDYQNQQIDRASGDLQRERDLQTQAMGAYGQAMKDESMADYFNANAQRDAFGQYLDSILAIGGMGGSGSSSGSSSSMSMSADGGAALAMFSDETLKKNKKKTGEKVGVEGTDKELDVYEYEPTKEGEKLGMPKGKQRGVMAQDMEKAKPSAVKKDKKSGKKKVDYGVLSARPQRG